MAAASTGKVTILHQLQRFTVPSTTGSAVPNNCARTYVVKMGDSCDSICDSQGVSTYQLKSVNNGIINPVCNNLGALAGKTICLGIKRQDCLNTYVIKPNDNCDSIAAAFGIATSTLLSNNPNVLEDCSTIYLNEVIDSFLSLLNVYLIHYL
ncbi:hypothetical protein HD554DRAFT_2025728 [Boletus coccyginus]|nr:hypothetical protein HD554DRAFT_2025728 [Boletus coccyginus]